MHALLSTIEILLQKYSFWEHSQVNNEKKTSIPEIQLNMPPEKTDH